MRLSFQSCTEEGYVCLYSLLEDGLRFEKILEKFQSKWLITSEVKFSRNNFVMVVLSKFKLIGIIYIFFIANYYYYFFFFS